MTGATSGAPEGSGEAADHTTPPQTTPQTTPQEGSKTTPQQASRKRGRAPGRADQPGSGEYGEPGEPLARSPFLVGLTAGSGLVLAYLGYLAIQSIWSILVLIIVAGFLAIGLNPAVVRLQALGLSRGLAVALVGLIGLLVGCGGVLALIPPLVNETVNLINAVPGYIEDLRRSPWVSQINDEYNLLDRVQDALTADNITTALGGIYSGATLLFGQLFNLVTVGVLTLYFLAAFDRLKEGAYRFVPASRRERARLLGDAILARVGGYMVGSLLIASLSGLTSLVFMLITGIPYALALAFVVAIFGLIPQIGATLGAVVLALVGLTVSVPVAVAALVFFILYQQLENWVIYPRVMRRTTHISDLAAILGVLLGASLMGVVGVLIAIPATAAIQLIVREVVFPRQNAN